MGLPVTETTFSGKALHVELPPAHIEYNGTLSADGKEIDGTFTQGAQMPLAFKRVDQVEALVRPQTPKARFPYDSIDVTYQSDLTYQSKAGDVTLAGTLTVPRPGGPFPVAIMITGSGPEDRDETLFGHKPFLVIADYLARRGVAVLRVDDRGVGKSGLIQTGWTHPARRWTGDEAVAQGRAIQEMIVGVLKSEPDEKLAAEKIAAAWIKMKASRPEPERKQLDAAEPSSALRRRLLMRPNFAPY